ncbi:hypothetical protein BD779DRAFT_1453911, partial [Infundibulicybe gibba]
PFLTKQPKSPSYETFDLAPIPALVSDSPAKSDSNSRPVSPALLQPLLPSMSDPITESPSAMHPDSNFKEMPRKGDRAAPVFDPKYARSIHGYFKHLEQLFTEAGLKDDAKMKKAATTYVDFETGETWEGYDVYETGTYTEFKKKVLHHYPGGDNSPRYTRGDLDALVSRTARIGIKSLDDLIDYARKFQMITDYLRSAKRMHELDLGRRFLDGFPPSLAREVDQQIRMMFPEREDEDSDTFEDVQKAARIVLRRAMSRPAVSSAPAPVTATDMASIFKDLQQSLIQALAPQPGNSATFVSIANRNCNFCGLEGHFVARCPVAEQYVQDGKIRRNHENRIVLSTGAYIPGPIQGRTMQERVDEWHRRNPGQLAAGRLSSNANPTSQMIYSINTVSTPRSANTYHYGREVNALKQPRRFMESVDVPRVLQRPSSTSATSSAAKNTPQSPVQELAVPGPTPEVTITPPEEDGTDLHPFRHVKEAAYAPPQQRNLGAPAGKPSKPAAPAYKTSAPVQDSATNDGVLERMLGSSVMLTLKELLAASPEARSSLKDMLTPRRIATPDESTLMLAETELLPFPVSNHPDAPTGQAPPPPDSIVIPDKYDTFITTHGSRGHEDYLKVAKESHALRSLMVLVDNQKYIEAIIDPGSQIIAMSEEVCHGLGLTYDPTVQLSMQSANGDVDLSLGLARNVSLRIGDITLFVQIHVIRAPAYDILLGRPFDVLTGSIVKNYSNEDQTITLKDPNTGQVSTLQTLPRSNANQDSHQSPDFQKSRM